MEDVMEPRNKKARTVEARVAEAGAAEAPAEEGENSEPCLAGEGEGSESWHEPRKWQ
eukprot:XP_001702165.1 predicted protein [Chlamydomonas reinhardtii]